MALKFTVRPGYTFSNGEKVTYGKLNLLGSPRIEGSGTIVETDIEDGSISTEKLKSSVNINSKIDDHNLGLNKLAQGTHGQVLYYDAEGDLVTLAPGTSGYFLSTNGVGKSPSWKAALTGDGTVAYNAITTNGLGDQYLTTNTSGVVEWIAKPTSNSASVYDTSDLAAIIAAGSPYTATQAHGLGVVPEQVVVTLRCTADDSSNTGYVEGDEVLLSGTHCNKKNSQGEIPAASAIVDSTNVVVQVTGEVRSDASKFLVYKKSDHTQVGIGSSASKFVFRIRVWATGAGSSASNNAGPLTSEPGYYYEEESSSTLDTIYTGTGPKQVFSHGLGAVPRLTRVVLKFTDAVTQLPGYVAGDEVDIGSLIGVPAGGALEDRSYNAAHIINNASGVTVQFSMAAGVLPNLTISNPSNGELSAALTSATMAKIKLKAYVWK
jgi:hypothetical protein